MLLISGLYFIFANWFICSQVGHECSACMVVSPDSVSISNDIQIKGIEEFQLVPKVIDFTINNAIPDTGYFFPIFLNHVKSVIKQKSLVITGHYFDTEENPTTYENLGIARADAVKQILLEKGIDETKIELTASKESNLETMEVLPNPSFSIAWVKSQQLNSDTQKNLENIMGTVYPDTSDKQANAHPVAATKIIDSLIINEETSKEDIKEKLKEEKKVVVDPNSKVERLKDKVILYFPFNSIKIKNYKDVDVYLTELAALLKEHKNYKVVLTGHTDDRGSVFANNRVAHRRAKIIRDILKRKGVSRSQIATESKGSSMPLLPNTSKANRKKNRRVEVSVIK